MSGHEHLDKLRAEGTPGLWAQHPSANDTVVGQYVDHSDDDEGPEFVNVADCRGEWPSNKYEQEEADSALIVAAVNALPKHTAALRAVLDLHHPEHWQNDGRGRRNLVAGVSPDSGPKSTTCAHKGCGYWPCATVTASTEALDQP